MHAVLLAILPLLAPNLAIYREDARFLPSPCNIDFSTFTYFKTQRKVITVGLDYVQPGVSAECIYVTR